MAAQGREGPDYLHRSQIYHPDPKSSNYCPMKVNYCADMLCGGKNKTLYNMPKKSANAQTKDIAEAIERSTPNCNPIHTKMMNKCQIQKDQCGRQIICFQMKPEPNSENDDQDVNKETNQQEVDRSMEQDPQSEPALAEGDPSSKPKDKRPDCSCDPCECEDEDCNKGTVNWSFDTADCEWNKGNASTGDDGNNCTTIVYGDDGKPVSIPCHYCFMWDDTPTKEKCCTNNKKTSCCQGKRKSKFSGFNRKKVCGVGCCPGSGGWNRTKNDRGSCRNGGNNNNNVNIQYATMTINMDGAQQQEQNGEEEEVATVRPCCVKISTCPKKSP